MPYENPPRWKCLLLLPLFPFLWIGAWIGDGTEWALTKLNAWLD